MHATFRLTAPMFVYNKEMICDHLLRLPLPDRYLRFCHAVSDQAVRDYVDTIDATHDAVCVRLSDDGRRVVGMLHVAVDGGAAEFALSVDVDCRQKGVGGELFDRGLMFCRYKGIDRVYMNCLATNTAIKRMAIKRNMSITTDYGESLALLDINDPASVTAWLESLQNDSIALYDAGCRYTYTQWKSFVDSVRMIQQQ